MKTMKTMAAFVIALVFVVPTGWAQTPADQEHAELAKALKDAKIPLERGLTASAKEGKPISAKYEVEDGKLQLSVYTMKGTNFSEVIVDHKTGKIAKAEPITKGDDLSHAKEQSEAMAKAKRSLGAAASEAVKENQGNLLEEVRDSFRMLVADSVAEQIDCGHGRVERRTCSVIDDLTLLQKPSEWVSLKGLVRIQAERFHKATGKTENQTRYYITSLSPDATKLNQAIRQHWGIENKLHWILDVAFGEDLSRKRAGHAAQNFSLINRLALNLLKQDKTSKLGIHGKRLKAGWDNHYLLKVLAN